MVGGGSTDDGISPQERGGELAPVQALRVALERYEESRSPQALDLAFATAARAVADRRGERARTPPEVGEVRNLFKELPEYEELVNLAVSETEHSVQAAGARLWDWFGLSTPPPRWNDGERARARLLVACACAPLDEQVVRWLGPRLLKLAADRWAGLLTAQLRAADEQLWQRVLGERYESVWRRCAPRGRWRTRELSDLLVHDDDVAASLQRQLARWLRDGARMERLTDEVEAAFVHSRTPDRLA
ncbi:MAG TPA: hypothetical protein VME22_21490 [Solirubrobacteraceae bacterium]|nr:hypothetical protein [Solirubrobacteraceae bacterium]